MTISEGSGSADCCFYHDEEKLAPPLPALVKDLSGESRNARPEGCCEGFAGGCYYLTYRPGQSNEKENDAFRYLGTLRVERLESSVVASGDLYYHDKVCKRQQPLPSHGIPIFSRNQYEFYLRMTDFSQRQGKLRLVFERYKYYRGKWWTLDGLFTAALGCVEAPPAYPRPDRYWRGVLRDGNGTERGDFAIGWVSPFLRRATLEIGAVKGLPLPKLTDILEYGEPQNLTWREVFGAVGWALDPNEKPGSVSRAGDESGETDKDLETTGTSLAEPWSIHELQEYTSQRHEASDLSRGLDREWQYTLLCVGRIDGVTRGLMHDTPRYDKNKIPRESAALTTSWLFSSKSRNRGEIDSERMAQYFRTAVHEVGHMMNLEDRAGSRHNGFMTPTSTIKDNAREGLSFPRNIEWAFAPADQKRLRHWPDPWVRPGGIEYGHGYRSRASSADEVYDRVEGLELQVIPVSVAGDDACFPLGAPIRLDLRLENSTGQDIQVPKLNLRARHVRVQVFAPGGARDEVIPMFLDLDPEAGDTPHVLPSGKSYWHGVTLLYGAKGALFPMVGMYRIVAEVAWRQYGEDVLVSGGCEVMVWGANNPKHAQVALKILKTPDSLFAMVHGGQDADAGVQAIQRALDVEELKPHYLFTEARRLFKEGRLDKILEQAGETQPVVTAAEEKAVRRMIERIGEGQEGLRDWLTSLRDGGGEPIE